MLSSILLTSSAVIVGGLGSGHLLLTFRGRKLHPTNASLIQEMMTTAPRITPDTTIWKMWIGFNASHSLGAMLYGSVFGYFALCQPDVFFSSTFLQIVGFLMVGSFVILARRFWFIVPFVGTSLALIAYVAAVIVNRVL